MKSELLKRWDEGNNQRSSNFVAQGTDNDPNMRQLLESKKIPTCLSRVLFEMALQRVCLHVLV